MAISDALAFPHSRAQLQRALLSGFWRQDAPGERALWQAFRFYGRGDAVFPAARTAQSESCRLSGRPVGSFFGAVSCASLIERREASRVLRCFWRVLALWCVCDLCAPLEKGVASSVFHGRNGRETVLASPAPTKRLRFALQRLSRVFSFSQAFAREEFRGWLPCACMYTSPGRRVSTAVRLRAFFGGFPVFFLWRSPVCVPCPLFAFSSPASLCLEGSL